MAANLRIALAELLREAEVEPDLDFIREGVRVMMQALLELDVEGHLGAQRYERSPDRMGQRNGYRERQWDTRVGTLDLQVPRVRDGSYYPLLLEPRKRAERALVAVVQEATCWAYPRGVWTGWSSPWGCTASARVRSGACAKNSMWRSSAFATGAWRAGTPCVPGLHVRALRGSS